MENQSSETVRTFAEVYSSTDSTSYKRGFCHQHTIGRLLHGKTYGSEASLCAVSVDSGALELDKVYDLIMEGNDLLVDVEKEFKLLQDRSMLYCICRKPYDQREMIACDKCDEWYHFDCIKLTSPPKVYACPACKLDTEYVSLSPSSSSSSQERSTNKCEEPQTPSPGRTDSRRTKQLESLCKKRNKPDSTENSNMSRLSGFANLLWRNRKPFRRVARKREELDILSPLFHVQQ